MRNVHVKNCSTPSERVLMKMLYIILFSVPHREGPHDKCLLFIFIYFLWNWFHFMKFLWNWFPYNTQCSSQQVPSSVSFRIQWWRDMVGSQTASLAAKKDVSFLAWKEVWASITALYNIFSYLCFRSHIKYMYVTCSSSKSITWGTWVVQLVKCLTLDFHSGHDLTVPEI